MSCKGGNYDRTPERKQEGECPTAGGNCGLGLDDCISGVVKNIVSVIELSRIFRNQALREIGSRGMQVPLWLFVASVLIALTGKEMASLLLKRVGGSSGGGSLLPWKDIRAASLLSSSGGVSRLQFTTSTSASTTTSITPLRSQSSSQTTNKHFSTSTHLNQETDKMAANVSAATLLTQIKNRRTYYQLSKSSPISDKAITDIVYEALKHSPSSFNSQSTRVVVLLKEEHDKLWDIAKEALKAIVSEDQWTATEQRLNGFQAAYGTVSASSLSISFNWDFT